VGDDDRNEGSAEGECIEHVWRLAGVSLSFGKVPAAEDYECRRCGAMAMRESGPAAG
jgi:hypothetical protein